MSAARRPWWGVAIATLGLSIALTPASVSGLPAAVASHHHGPSAGQVARSKQAVTSEKQQVEAATGSIIRAKATLARLDVTAEVAFEAYDGARVKLAAAQRAVTTAHQVLVGANNEVTKGEARAGEFATAAYESGSLTGVGVYLAPGGPASLVHRLGTIDAISSSQHDTLARLSAAQLYQAVVSRRAQAVQATAAAAATTANRAKAAADRAVQRQSAVLTGLQHEKAHLAALLSQAQAHAGQLERARARALARARAAARRRAEAARQASSGPGPYQGSSGSLAGTASAATELAALHVAETQIGKPYVWGAAGPNSYDCSGLVLWAYAQEGIPLLHWTGDQWNEGAHVSQSQLRPGDLVFFATNTSDVSTIHHVGLYVGNGEMLDAPYTGVNVRYDSAERPDYIGAVRPYAQ